MYSAGLRLPRANPGGYGSLEQAGGLVGVRHKHALGLGVVRHHHLVGLAPEAGLLVSTKCCVRRVGVVVVYPHATRLDRATGTVGSVVIAGPHACPE